MSTLIHEAPRHGRQARLRRIRRAARRLFSARGYEGTSTRAIAAAAGVGVGTVFLYYGSKRRLLLDLFAEQVRRAQERALATLPSGGAPIDALMHVFDELLRAYAEDPRLARVFLRELLFAEPEVRAEMEELTAEFFDRLVGLVRQRGGVDASVAREIVYAAFGLYYFTLIAWMGGAMADRRAASARLRRALDLLPLGGAEGTDGRD